MALDKWFIAIWLLSNCRNGISSLELHRSIGVTQKKTAWFMLHRIRLAMKSESIEKSDDTAEADETFIGGKAKNISERRRYLDVAVLLSISSRDCFESIALSKVNKIRIYIFIVNRVDT